MELYEIVILVLVIWLCVYVIVSRICECIEKYALYQSFGKVLLNESGECNEINRLFMTKLKELCKTNGKYFTGENAKTPEN